jgi:hypothetical protein
LVLDAERLIEVPVTLLMSGTTTGTAVVAVQVTREWRVREETTGVHVHVQEEIRLWLSTVHAGVT